jgi:hypothetical protein
MLQVATSTSPQAKHLIRCAQYNVGRAYYQGYGVRRSDEEAERFGVFVQSFALLRCGSNKGLFVGTVVFANNVQSVDLV